jgi:hypothetical protein
MKLEFSWQIFEKKKPSNIRLHPNPSSGNRIVPRGKTDRQTDGQTDMTKLIVAFRKFVKSPKNKIKLLYISKTTVHTSMSGITALSGPWPA